MSRGPATLVNGETRDWISVQDRGFQYGDGLFETLAVEKGAPLLWERHMQRLFRGAGRLGVAAPEETVLRNEVGQICHGATRAVLKIILTRGVAGRGYAPPANATPTRIVSLLPWPDYPAQHREHGVTARFCRTMLSHQPMLAGIKHLNRLEQVLARAELAQDAAEGLMLDERGNVIEGTMSNLFAVARGVLTTPDLSACGVEGVMRNLVLERAAALSISCRVGVLKRDDILNAEEVFLTNSLIGIWPVRRIGSREFSVGETTRRWQRTLRDAYCAD